MTIALVALMSLVASAQVRPSIIVSAGYQGANMRNIGLESVKPKMLSGARAGVAVDMPLLESGVLGLSFQPGVNFSMKGYKYAGESTSSLVSGKYNVTTNLYYLDIPILANLTCRFGDNLGVYINAGPYLSYGFLGKITSSGEVKSGDYAIGGKILDGNHNTNPFKKDKNGNSLYNPFDWGFQVGAGLEISRFMVGVNVQYGLMDLSKHLDKSQSNTSFAATVGYRF